MNRIKQLIHEYEQANHNGEHSCIGCLLAMVGICAAGLFIYICLIMFFSL